MNLNKPRCTCDDEFGNADIVGLEDVMPDLYANLDFNDRNRLTDVLNRFRDLEVAIESGELVPVVHGKWKVDECDTSDNVPSYSWIEFHCPKCNTDYGLEEGQYNWCRGEKIPYHFCPNCGAKMDEKDGDGEILPQLRRDNGFGG